MTWLTEKPLFTYAHPSITDPWRSRTKTLPSSPFLQRNPPATATDDEVIDQAETHYLPRIGHSAGKG